MCFQKVYVTNSRSSNEISNPTFNEGLKKSIRSKTVVEKQSHSAGHFSGKHHHDRQCRWEASSKRGGGWEASRRGWGSLGGGAPADPLSAEWSMSFLTEAALPSLSAGLWSWTYSASAISGLRSTIDLLFCWSTWANHPVLHIFI